MAVLESIMGSVLFKNLEKILGSNTAKFAGNMYANSVNAGLNRSDAQNMEERIAVARRHGIHPLEAIGGSTSSGPTIPLQNPFGGTSIQEPKDEVEEKTKRLVLEQLQNESNDRKYKYSLLVPVSLKPGDPKKYWGLNSHYFGYTFVASSIQAAANGKEAWSKIVNGMTKEQRAQVEKIRKQYNLSIPDQAHGTGGM